MTGIPTKFVADIIGIKVREFKLCLILATAPVLVPKFILDGAVGWILKVIFKGSCP